MLTLLFWSEKMKLILICTWMLVWIWQLFYIHNDKFLKRMFWIIISRKWDHPDPESRFRDGTWEIGDWDWKRNVVWSWSMKARLYESLNSEPTFQSLEWKRGDYAPIKHWQAKKTNFRQKNRDFRPFSLYCNTWRKFWEFWLFLKNELICQNFWFFFPFPDWTLEKIFFYSWGDLFPEGMEICHLIFFWHLKFSLATFCIRKRTIFFIILFAFCINLILYFFQQILKNVNGECGWRFDQ